MTLCYVRDDDCLYIRDSFRPTVKIKRLDKSLPLPRYQTEGDAGIDLCSRELSETVEPGIYCRFSTGIAIELPPGYEAQVRGRSSWAEVLDYFHVGTVDSGYRGEIHVCFRLKVRKRIEHGDRIAQLVIAPVAEAELVEADELAETVRGDKGFGSSGVR